MTNKEKREADETLQRLQKQVQMAIDLLRTDRIQPYTVEDSSLTGVYSIGDFIIVDRRRTREC